MGSLGHALGALLDSQPSGQEVTRPGTGGVNEPSRLASWYQFLKAKSVSVLGEPATAFAVYDHGRGVVRVYAKDPRCVDIVADDALFMLEALQCAQEAGASFTVCGDEVLCVLDSRLTRGKSYGDAALQALVAAQRSKNMPVVGDAPAGTGE